MSRSLSAIVEELVSQRVLASIPYVKLVRIKDFTPPILAGDKTAPAYFSTHPFSNLFGRADEEPNLPWLLRVDFPAETMAHLPSPVGGGVDTLTRRISFALANVDYQGVSLYEFLTSEARLDRAELTLETLVVPPCEMGFKDRFQSFIPGNSTAGDIVTFFEGLVDRVTAVGDAIECRGRTELPVTPWKLVPDDGSDPRDRGLRLPLVLGQDARTRCVNLQVGALSTLELRLAIGATQVHLDDASDFPSSGSAMVAAEKISWTDKTGNTLEDVTRNEDGTTEADHVIGSGVVELQPVVLGVSSELISSVKNLFIRSEISGSLVRVPGLLYTADYNDQSNAPGSVGDGIVTVTLSSQQLAVLLNSVIADAAVTQQPQYSTDISPTVFTDDDPTTVANNVTFARVAGATGDWSSVTTAPNWQINKSSGVQEGLRGVFSNGFTKNEGYTALTARFDFTVSANTVDRDISVGIVATGLEDILVGFVDGSVVASVTILAGSSGTIVTEGQTFQAVEGTKLSEIHPNVILDFIIGEAPGGNPIIDFDVDSVSCEYTILNEIDAVVEESVDQPGTQQIFGSGQSEHWDGTFTTNPPTQVQDGTGPDDQSCRISWPSSDFPVLTDGLINGVNTLVESVRWEWSTTSSGDVNDFACDANFAVFGWNNILTSAVIEFSDHTTPGTILKSVTRTFVPGTTLDDCYDRSIRLTQSDGFETSNSPATAVWDHFRMRLTTLATTSETPLTQTVPAQIQASAGGIGLEFYALCDGPEADDTSWNAADGEVLSHPGDLMRYWLENIHGLTNVDTATFSGATYAAATPDYQFGFDARNLGSSFAEVLLQLGYEGSANVTQPSGGDWTITFPNASFQFPAASVTITDIGDLISIGKDDDEIKTRLIVNSHYDPRFDNADNRSFSEVQTTVATDALVIAREVEFGRQDADPMFLFAHNDTVGVKQWKLYQEQELGRFARVFSFRGDWWQCYALEIGDIIEVDHPLVDGGVAVKSRVIEVQHSASGGIQLRAVEVL